MSSCPPPPPTLPSGAEPTRATLPTEPERHIADTGTDPYDALGPGAEVPRARTPLTALELRSALIVGHKEATGEDVSPQRLSMGLAMCSLEHAAVIGGHVIPGGAVWCNNLGNINARGWSGDWFYLTAHEDLPAGPRMVTQRLRAHSGPEAGAADYWALLLRRWPDAVAAMDRGSVDEVAHALKEQLDADGHPAPYYSAPVEQYAAGMRRWAR